MLRMSLLCRQLCKELATDTEGRSLAITLITMVTVINT